ncbi:hypothetical protein CANCADRAFT_148588 [Tortispora caseinolytica NRRL Y-17796]|uniref:Fe2OG dioxygenase domain-containing protein n=1 Tax=Tortispora caseinolytica NRRL Y-17796 TaxID=767744 RepID=A0A1E4TDC5_9ASCO|nr:hypothetical protein CANCADRAFT_148588 [Tortispora caseinolytica NRRL Y-17796]
MDLSYLSSAMQSLPIIDLSLYQSPAELGKALMKVGRNPGFFYVVNHNVSRAMIEDVFAICSNFFLASSIDEKMQFHNGSGDLGYTALRDETLAGKGKGDLKESYYMKNVADMSKLPSLLETSRTALQEFFTQTQILSELLLKGFAKGLGLDESYLVDAHSGSHNRMRLIHYPRIDVHDIPTPPPEGSQLDEDKEIRAGIHSDYGSITLLYQQESDKGGLQVKSTDGDWIDVPAIPGAVVVNIGDALEFWTAGQLSSTLHRVAFPRNETESGSRFSIPYFVQPNDDFVLSPLLKDDEESQKRFDEVVRTKGYTSKDKITSGEHLRQRIQSTYRTSQLPA